MIDSNTQTLPSDPLIPEAIAAVILDPTAYADGRIYEAYAWLRNNNPIGRIEAPGFDSFWVITKHDDIKEISSRNNDFHSGDKAGMLIDQAGMQHILDINNGKPNFVSSLVFMDPPMHPKYRALTQKWFMPVNLRNREEEIRAIARKTVDKMESLGGQCDFVHDISLGYPLHVIMNIFGVPESDEQLMLQLTQEMFGGQDPEISGEEEMLSAKALQEYQHQNVVKFTQYFEQLGDARRRNPQDDLATLIANAKIDGEPIPEREEIGYYITVATAGHDTTSNTTACAMRELASNPALLQRLKDDPSLIPKFVDEAIRWATPIKHFMRSAACDTEAGGRSFKTGDWLMLCYASANRDNAVINNPDIFDIDRVSNKHLSFGFGPHLCLGQHLGKMEIRILFEELIPRLSNVKITGEPKMADFWFINGLKNLPLNYIID